MSSLLLIDDFNLQRYTSDYIRRQTSSYMIETNSSQLRSNTTPIDYTMDAIDVLTKGLTELNLQRESLTSELMTEIHLILAEYLSGTMAESGGSGDILCTGDSSSPSYVLPAYQWLLGHLHNPYPSSRFKSSLVEKSNVSLKSINVWFANVRRRIGWTSLSKRFFYGNRADTVDFAHRVFKRKPSDVLLDEAISSEFLSMKVKAENLYHGKLNGLNSSKVPHTFSVYDDSDGFFNSNCLDLSLGERIRRSVGRVDVVNVTNNSDRLCFPSLKQNKKRSRDESSLSDTTKTLSSCYEPYVVEQTRKRFRTPSSSSTQSSSRSSTPMPSTPKDDSPVEIAFEDWRKSIENEIELVDESESPSLMPISRPRKRRLSQSDDLSSSTKRPRGIPLPRLHIVSDSYAQSRALINVEPCDPRIDLTLPKPVTINEPLPDNAEIALFRDWANLSSLVPVNPEINQTSNEQVTEPDTLVSVSTTPSSQDDGQNHCPPETSSETSSPPLDLPNFDDLDKFLEALTADPSLLPPLLPEGLEQLSLFDSNFFTSLGGFDFAPLAALDIPLSNTLVDTDSVAEALYTDVASVPLSNLPLSTSLEEENDTDCTDFTSDSKSGVVVVDKLETSTTLDDPSLLDFLCPVSPVEIKASVEIEPVTEHIPQNENIDNSTSDTREDKLQKLQMLMAEVERLKQEISS